MLPQPCCQRFVYRGIHPYASANYILFFFHRLRFPSRLRGTLPADLLEILLDENQQIGNTTLTTRNENTRNHNTQRRGGG
jgi:hypothetical protein